MRATVCMGAVAILEGKQRKSEQFCGASFAKLNYSSEQSSKNRSYLRNYRKKYFKKSKCYDRKAFSALFESFVKKEIARAFMNRVPVLSGNGYFSENL